MALNGTPDFAFERLTGALQGYASKNNDVDRSLPGGDFVPFTPEFYGASSGIGSPLSSGDVAGRLVRLTDLIVVLFEVKVTIGITGQFQLTLPYKSELKYHMGHWWAQSGGGSTYAEGWTVVDSGGGFVTFHYLSANPGTRQVFDETTPFAGAVTIHGQIIYCPASGY